jgi:D-alanyl-D-alanine carboxypeptidase/D-alanyl-D-alanine-endopeptidase (penicillin-binding protein 4)
MKNTILLLCGLICFTPAAPARDFGAEIDALLKNWPVMQRSHFGLKVVDLQTGEVIAQRENADFFTPASNTKLYTTAFALSRLGTDYTFRTELRTSGAWRPGVAVIPDLQLIGSGDPNLSGRVIPYAANSQDGDPLSGIKDLASKLCEAGVNEINGDVTGEASRYGPDLYPDGWTLGDSVYGYGAPVSALTVNDGVISVSVQPGAVGELASVTTSPALDYFVILNEIETDASDEAEISVKRPAGSNEVILSGTIGTGAPQWTEDLAVNDPALFAAEGLIEELRWNGAVVRGAPKGRYCCDAPVGTVLAAHESPSLGQAVRVVNKVSQNLHAEMLLREAGLVSNGSGTLESALSARQDFLQSIGIAPDQSGFAFADGSGLARQGLTTPDSTVALLRYMWQSPLHDVWLSSLPVGGVDGSLQHRFKNMAGADHVHAKTGSLSHVSSLSGYIETQKHGWLAFSIMVNDAVGQSADVHAFMDAFCGLFLGY